jgi:hypothetical protein
MLNYKAGGRDVFGCISNGKLAFSPHSRLNSEKKSGVKGAFAS